MPKAMMTRGSSDDFDDFDEDFFKALKAKSMTCTALLLPLKAR
jgi:hypothetical protein